MGELPDAQARLIDQATAAAGSASLSDIQHVVILMQENRSFDHYFGTLSGVRGFSDPNVASQSVGGQAYPIFDQFGYQPGKGADASGYLQPFRLYSDPPLRDGQTTNDISHTWPTQHDSWHGGTMDKFVATQVSNPAVWAQTVLFVTHDENGGFFDHVPPPTPPPGTEGEWLTGNLPAAAGGINGPVGLGFRVPCLVISPFSRGGYVCSQRFDHTSLLRFIETRFGVEVPNLSPWRRGVTGDMTAALALSRPPDTSVPALPPTSLGPTGAAEQAVLNSLAGTLDLGIDYPLPTANSMPSQETSPARPPVP